MSWDNNAYDNPEKHGLVLLGDIEWSRESYEFNMTAVWHEPATGAFYWADDSGCSCPSPFETYDNVADLTKAERTQNLIDHLNAKVEANSGGRYDHVSRDELLACVGELMARVMAVKHG